VFCVRSSQENTPQKLSPASSRTSRYSISSQKEATQGILSSNKCWNLYPSK